MALALGVKEKDKVYVGDCYVQVIETRGFDFARVEVGSENSCRVKVYDITDKKATEILPGVFVSCGRPDQRFIDKHARLLKDYEDAQAVSQATVGMVPPNPGRLLPRLIFEAPRSITILREELYRRSKAAA